MSKFRNLGEKLPKITKNLTYSCYHWENFPNNKSTWYASWKSSKNLYSVGYTEIDSINYILAREYGEEGERETYYFKESDILELAKEQNMIEKEFKLPEKWCVKADGLSGKYFNEQSNNECYTFNKGYYHRFNHRETSDITIKGDYAPFFHHDWIKEGYTEITFEQFCKYVLKKENNMNKKIVGYKLLKELPFVKIGVVSYFNSKNECAFITLSNTMTDSFIFTKEELEEAPDWFQPVYELEEVTLILSNGKSVVVGKEKIKAEDTNIHFRDLQNIITLNKNSVNNWQVELTDATYKIGCWENVKLSDIKLILKTYKDFTK